MSRRITGSFASIVDARVGPRGSLENLSQDEIGKLLDSGSGGLYSLFRKCALAVLNSGADTDNAKEIFDRYKDFDVAILRQAWGNVGREARKSVATDTATAHEVGMNPGTQVATASSATPSAARVTHTASSRPNSLLPCRHPRKTTAAQPAAQSRV